MTERNTLPMTMELFQTQYGLKACARTWKSKLKEWKFDKYLVDREKDVSIAKVAKRRREGKTTALLREDRQISPGRLADFKRRKRESSVVVVSPSTETAEDLACHSPLNGEEATTHGVINQRPSSQHQDSDSTLVGISRAASLNWFKTVANDSSLFLSARAAGLVRILVKDLEDELERTEQNGEPINASLWWNFGTSGINVWCDYCLKIIGDQVLYDCHTCPDLTGGNWVISYCFECNYSKKTLCQAENHQLVRDDCFKSSRCLDAAYPDLERWCDAVDCGKKISGLYFHCCICDSDNFDLCLQCVMGGRVCQDMGHVLSPGVRPIEREIGCEEACTQI